MSKIEKTKDYEKFKFLSGNRKVSMLHARKLAKSIDTHNLLEYQPIMISADGYVIDGQHRIEACKILDIAVPYVKIPTTTVETIRMLNTNMKPWNLRQFVESYAETGHKDYQFLLEMWQDARMPFATLVAILYGDNIPTGGGKYAELIRSGKFRIKKEKQAQAFIQRLRDISQYTTSSVWKTRDFMRALTILYEKGADHERLVHKLSTSPNKLAKQGDHVQYLFRLVEIYNDRLPAEQKLSVL